MRVAEPVLEIQTWRWREAQALARMAYAAYREAQDSADEAQDALAWRVQSRDRRT